MRVVADNSKLEEDAVILGDVEIDGSAYIFNNTNASSKFTEMNNFTAFHTQTKPVSSRNLASLIDLIAPKD